MIHIGLRLQVRMMVLLVILEPQEQQAQPAQLELEKLAQLV
jgi:hypothetical protein